MDYLCQLENGKKVWYDSINSHFATHLSDTPELSYLVEEFLKKEEFTDQLVIKEHDAGHVIGNMDLVETTEKDEIVYAKRLNRDNFTRFVKNRMPIPTSYFTVALKMQENGDYELLSAWIGTDCPPFPDEPWATAESKEFWKSHALVWGTQEIQEGTETTKYPW